MARISRIISAIASLLPSFASTLSLTECGESVDVEEIVQLRSSGPWTTPVNDLLEALVVDHVAIAAPRPLLDGPDRAGIGPLLRTSSGRVTSFVAGPT